MVVEDKARMFFCQLLHGWSINALRQSGCLLMAWNPKTGRLEPYLTSGGLPISGSFTRIERELNY